MDEETARKIYDGALALDPILLNLRKTVDLIEDETLRHQFTRAVGDVMGVVFAEVMHPIERQFPNLIPLKERATR
ncbi:hypothetical protein [Bosea vaviloviae]|uniref:Uncharacterized protein n=1 Tax=Bosea vaviloviae TaxID=1526658 RepID=A0A0N1N3E3_9HYPH|nr:hypothetical protein [Bosea vaviloviae]KPH83012.1 hypothetical protein AE618_01235 [Bosea vaviloviae]